MPRVEEHTNGNGAATEKKKPRGKPFVKGDPRTNKKGRPKGSLSLTTIMRRLLQEAGADGIEQAEKLARAWILHAAKGNAAIAKEIWNRMDGAVPQDVDLNLSIGVFGELPEEEIDRRLAEAAQRRKA